MRISAYIFATLPSSTQATPILSSTSNSSCKATPLDSNWPSSEQWTALNSSIAGSLIKTVPVASSCYSGNPFGSTVPCNQTETSWSVPDFHISLPESVQYPLYANNTCLPPSVAAYDSKKPCSIGGLPQYIVNATCESHIATAMAWAASHNIRVVVRGTGHDINGRSAGAYGLSIWTHNFRNIEYSSLWPIPGSNETTDVVIAGSGNVWRDIYSSAEQVGKLVVGGGAGTVGLGGFIQGGGHGPASSIYGRAADQILQVKVVTTEGEILIANSQKNQDLLFAIRGGGPGQYGVVTEYVLKTHPAPTIMVLGTLSLATHGKDNLSISQAWNALAVEVRSIPDIMDAQVTGQMTTLTSDPTNNSTLTSVHQFYGFNKTAAELTALLAPMMQSMREQGNVESLNVSLITEEFQNFNSLALHLDPPNKTAGSAGSGSIMSSRLLGREQINHISQAEVVSYLQRLLVSQSGGSATMVMGMQAGRGSAGVSEDMRGALHSSWRAAYIHTITFGASLDPAGDPQTVLEGGAEWTNASTEKLWEEWAPEMGSYINEANPFNPQFKKDYYGDNYERLVQIKRMYDPSESLFVLSGVGSDGWKYDLNSGKLCRV